MNAPRIYDYLLQSRARVLDGVRGLSAAQYRRAFPFGLKTIATTLTHVMVSEWYYVERLEGREVPAYRAWPIKEEAPPEFDGLERMWIGQSERIRGVIGGERDWGRRIAWRSFPDAAGRQFDISASAGDFFTQLAFHEVHHRAQVMAMLRELGRPVEDIDFNAMMFERVGVG